MAPEFDPPQRQHIWMTDDASQQGLFQIMAATAMDAIVVLDEAQRIVFFNPAAQQMFSCSADQALGQALDRFLPSSLHEIHHRHVATFGTTGDTSRSMGDLRPLTAHRADGKSFSIEATISRASIDGHVHYVAIVRDITARLETERRLQRQADLLDLANDAICTWGREGLIRFWNQGAERLYGYSSTEAVGQIGDELLQTQYLDGHEAMISTLERESMWDGELIQERRDGREVVIESHRVLVEAGEHHYVLEANRDITERKLAETDRIASLRREERSRFEAETAEAGRDALREILDALLCGTMVISAPEGVIEYANATMLELIHGSSERRSMTPVYDGDFRFLRFDGTPLLSDERPVVRALQGERIQNLQLTLQRSDGTSFPVEIFAAAMRSPSDARDRVIVGVIDATPLRQAEQLKDDFLALVSHELRTPLSAIHGGAHLLLKKAYLDQQMRAELLNDVVYESERLERLLSNLLSLVDITAGRLQASCEPVLMESIVNPLASEFGTRNPFHSFSVDVTPDLPPSDADPDLLDEVVRILYENAVKYSPHGGHVRTVIKQEGDAIALSVTDDGVGLASEHVASVFERFRRVGDRSRFRGMGLGLYLCRGLVEAQGGRISASSSGLDLGSTFTVILPVAHGWAETEDV
jgi:PAS domain S-box-containing protein